MKQRLARVVNSDAFSVIEQSLILLSVITFSISTLPDLSVQLQNILWIIELITVAIFSVEYGARIIVANRKFAYLFSFFGMVDLFAILPFYFASGIDLRTIRIFRLLRLFKLLKFPKYIKAINHFQETLAIVKEELILFTIMASIMVYLSAVGIYFCENEVQPDKFKSIFHALWWAVVTLTTVGYGDVVPITLGGQIFTTFILMIGLGMVAIPSGLIASALTRTHKNRL
jgi:voltage-gated potassium channel